MLAAVARASMVLRGPGQHGLAGAGHVLDEHVPLAQQGHHQQLDLRSLADDDRFDVADDAVSELGYGSLWHGSPAHNSWHIPA